MRYRRLAAALIILCCLSLFIHGSAWADTAWSQPLDLAQATHDVTGATLASDAAGNVHVVWSEQGNLYHRQKSGDIWSARQQIAAGVSPDLIADDLGLYLAFAGLSETANEIYVARWQPASGWDLPQNISQTEEDSDLARLARAVDGDLAVVWVEAAPGGGIIYVAQSDDGEVWSVAPLPDATGNAPVAAYDSLGMLAVAWEDVYDLGYPNDILIARQESAGWSLPENVSYTPEVNSSAPGLAASTGGLYLAWEEGVPGASTIYTSHLMDGIWQAPRPRSNAGTHSDSSLAFGAGTGYLIWCGETGVSQYVFDPERSIWVYQTDMPNVATNATGARLAVATRQHLVWITSQTGQPATLYYAERAISEYHFAALALPLILRR